MRIAVAGNGRLALSLIQPLLDSAHEVVALVQNGRLMRGAVRSVATAFSRTFGANSSVVGLAGREGIPVVWIDRMTGEELAPLRACGPDILLVGGFSVILKKPLLTLPRIGCVNAHSALLPKHRGPNPYSAVILAGDAETGITFHVMDEGIDTGDILERYAFPIEPDDTSMTVYDKGCDLAADHVVALMDRIEREGLHGTPQDPAVATYDKRLEAQDAVIDWQKPAEHVDRLLRACKPFLLPRFCSRGKTVYVRHAKWSNAPVDAEPGTVVSSRPFVRVATGRGTVTILIAYSGRPFPFLWPAPWNRPKRGEKMG